MNQSIGKTLIVERRAKPRINCDYPAMVQGWNGNGVRFTEKARVLNLSSSGVFLVAKRLIDVGSEVYVKIALPTGSLEWGTSKLATNGTVMRDEIQSNGTVGIAIKLEAYKFL